MIYTAVIGNIDKVREDITCFTDIRGFSVPRMASRQYKALSHLYFDCRTIWLDGNIFPVGSETDLFDELLGDADLGLFEHPYRKTVLEEAECVAAEGHEAKERIQRFIENHDENTLKLPLYENGVLLRNHNESIRRFNEIWWSLICRWSQRDQITCPIAIARSGVKIKVNRCDLRNHSMVKYIPHKT